MKEIEYLHIYTEKTSDIFFSHQGEKQHFAVALMTFLQWRSAFLRMWRFGSKYT